MQDERKERQREAIQAAGAAITPAATLPYAVRRYGELLRQLARTAPTERSPTGRAGKELLPANGTNSPYARALADTGVSTQAASRYQAPAVE